MRFVSPACFALSVIASSALAQAPTERKPGAEEKRIAFFAGRWSYEGETKPGPMGPGGKSKGTETCEWFAGGFQLVCRSQGTGPMGAVKGQSVMAYDPAEKTYTYYAHNNLGQAFFVRGNVSGQVWTWPSEMKMEGKVMNIRVTITELSPTSTSFKLEGSTDGGATWTLMEEAKGTKMK